MAGPKKPRAKRRTRAQIAAEQHSDYHAVCLLGYAEPVPRFFGDNRGCWPVKIATSKKPREAARRSDFEQPVHELVVLDFVQVETEEHARMLKAALDELLLGSSEDSNALRHGWRDIENDPAIVWPVLLKQAIERLTDTASAMRRRATAFEVFDEAEKNRRVARKMRGRE